MANLNSRVDADFFAMIHQHVTAAPPFETAAPEGEERRETRRRRWLGVQWVAYWDGGRFPADHEFQEVRCHDLSCGGFSFFVFQPLPGPQLVAAFGRKPDLIYLAAEQVHAVHVLLFPSGRVLSVENPEEAVHRRHPNGEIGQPLLLIGCRFLQRLDLVDG